MVVSLQRCIRHTTRHLPVEIQFDRIEPFPKRKRPVVLAATGAATGALRALVDDLEQQCTRLGLRADTRDWRCHMTLARIRGREPLDIDGVDIHAAFTARRVVLMESAATGCERDYVPIVSK
jgi:2'-5' RNA ligase|tara:strand:+ start:1918 stop:2283 length:366 start_codon:yes stop_codon:yes gene_type:complete